jgi:predicted GNAT family acetyltransferase
MLTRAVCMSNVKLEMNDSKRGKFIVTGGDGQSGEMDVAVLNGKLVVYHTEVTPAAEGKGFAKQMLAAMVDYAREHKLKVRPLCSYVHAQFKRHPADYSDVWTPSADNA